MKQCSKLHSDKMINISFT